VILAELVESEMVLQRALAAMQRASQEEVTSLQALQDHVDDFRRSMAAFRLASEKRDVKAAAGEGWTLLREVAACAVRGVSLPM
jgi:hypothetical protein